jgi:DNA-binding response OmpR family regulator
MSQPEAQSRPHAGAEAAPVGVHVFTDDDRIRQAARSLPAARYVVTYSDTAPDAIDEVRRSKPAVAVLELRVGDYGGFALAKDLHALPAMGKLPLVMLCDRPHDRWLCRQAGAQQVIVKPLPDPMALLLALDATLASL